MKSSLAGTVPHLAAIRKKIADTAKISPLRVVDLAIGVRPNGAQTLFFTLLNGTGMEQKNVTVGQQSELTVDKAKQNLNSTLTSGSLVVDVGSGKKITLISGSLQLEKDFYTTATKNIIQKSGYTGGKMAVLALFMLAIGAVLGVGGAWYKWRRTQGIAYHVYE